MIRTVLILAATLAPSIATAQQAGDQFQIARSVEIDERGEDAVSNSQNSDALIEKVISVTPAGIELEFSLPAETQSDWVFPVRVFKPKTGPLQLRDRAALEARIDPWLKKAGFTRADCGRWIASWTAFRLRCEPEAALAAVEPYAIGQLELVDGASYADAQALRPAPLKARADGKGYDVELALDPAAVREELVQADIQGAQLAGDKLTLDAARKAHAGDQITGTIKVTIDTAGPVIRRTRVARETITRAGNAVTRTITEIVERRPVGAPAPSPDSI